MRLAAALQTVFGHLSESLLGDLRTRSGAMLVGEGSGSVAYV
jgi:hypothetical protein